MARYHLVGDFSGWAILKEPMIGLSSGSVIRQLLVVRGEAPLARDGDSPVGERPHREEFQIVRDADWTKRVYPAEGDGTLKVGLPLRASAEPDQGHGKNWAVEGLPGTAFHIALNMDAMTVSIEEAAPKDGSPDVAARWRGVNLGGWLVLEQWMAPALFEEQAPGSADERSLMTGGGVQARQAVKHFRDTFITEDDFRWLRDVGGVNAVRLPVGFWCLEEHAAGTPYLPTRAYVDAAFDWAETHGLKVLLDLHGAAGSQNGQHHSGQSVKNPRWLSTSNRRMNLRVLLAWAKRWGKRKSFLGLGLGNEVGKAPPSLWTKIWGLFTCRRCRGITPEQEYWDEVAQFYVDASSLVRPHLNRGAPVVIDTCWETGRWAGRLRDVEGPVWLDYHHYQCFRDAANPGRVGEHCEAGDLYEALVTETAEPELMLGEFSLALPPDAGGYDNSDWQRRYFQQQTRLAAERSVGWFFWSYKVAREGWPHWSYRECVERGWIDPQLVKGANGSPGYLSLDESNDDNDEDEEDYDDDEGSTTAEHRSTRGSRTLEVTTPTCCGGHDSRTTSRKG